MKIRFDIDGCRTPDRVAYRDEAGQMQVRPAALRVLVLMHECGVAELTAEGATQAHARFISHSRIPGGRQLGPVSARDIQDCIGVRLPELAPLTDEEFIRVVAERVGRDPVSPQRPTGGLGPRGPRRLA